MDLKNIKIKISTFFNKNKYVVLILVIGLAFMLIPGRVTQESKQTTEEVGEPTCSQPALDETLAKILCRIDGAGDVQVLLTLAQGEETIYQTDTQTSTSSDTNTAQIETVVLSNTDRTQGGMIRQINPPTYLGAIVVCEGADSAAVRLAIVDAVSNVTGLGSDRISVLKMK